tara:strand:- start:126 stop:320 length:195 start_codon:yes stop_codon:yes gene_type:complete
MTKRNYFVSLLIEKPNEDPIYTPHRISAAYVQIYKGILGFFDEQDNLVESFEINEELHFDDISN